jgi:hypothetical protein
MAAHYTVAFNGDGSLFAAGSSFEGGEVRVYNANDGKRVRRSRA